MRKTYADDLKIYLSEFFEAIFNLFLFFPYFFSVSALFKTLFLPWKNIITRKTERGFSFTEWLNRLFFNLISRVIGCMMRLSIIFFYILLQSAYVILLPFIIIFFFLLLPLIVVIKRFEKTEEEQKAIAKHTFLASRLLKKENSEHVENWFEMHYQKHIHKKQWWKLQNLFLYPPLARDWAYGYTPILDEYTEDLTSITYQENMKAVVGREKEIRQLQQILIQNEEANTLIVGEEGVGKHTIVDALAKKIYEGQTHPLLAYKRILKLNLERILTAYTDQKQRENFLEDLFFEATEAKNIILLVENLDKYVSYSQGRIDLSISMEKYGKTSHVQFIGITSPFFYQRFIFTNEKINRIFTKVDVSEITPEEARKTLLEVFYLFEERNNVIIPYETIENTIDKSEFYITHIPFPEKAFNLLDMACAYVNQRRDVNTKGKTKPLITPDIIDMVLSEKTHIPTKLTEVMKQKLINLEKTLAMRVIYQDEALSKLSSAMRRSFILLGKRKKPLASFLFLGPTGVGKTETAKALSDVFFGSDRYLLRFDMSLYQTTEDIKTLIGSIESGIPGHLSKSIRENPYAVLLLDEIEKADKDLLNIFLTLIDEGYFTDGFGKHVDCKNLIVIATSNAGADYIFKQQTVMNKLKEAMPPDLPRESQPDKLNMDLDSQQNDLINHLVVNHLFSPEFLNRFDGVVTYHPISEKSIEILTKKMICSIQNTIYKLYKVRVTVSDETLKSLASKGYNPAYGARNLERVITQDLEDKIAKLILAGTAKEGETVTV